MAIKNSKLIRYLNETVELLEKSDHYEWGHSGACNCGHLAQVMTGHSKRDLHQWALEKSGDWTEKAEQYCPESGYKIDDIISVMLESGLSLDDIQHIEYLSHPEVIDALPEGQRSLERNNLDHVIAYFNAWIQVIEKKPHVAWRASQNLRLTEIEVHDSVPEDALVKVK